MAHAGDVIEHPVLGHRATFIRTAEETNGELLVLQFTIAPGGPRLPPHIHRLQLEQFDVPPGTPHGFRNVSESSAGFSVQYRPALKLESFFVALYALGVAGKVNRQGRPNPLWLAVLMSEFQEEFFYLPVIPWWLQRALAAPLALGRLLGYSSAKLV